MCRSIRVLHHFDPPTTREEMQAALERGPISGEGLPEVALQDHHGDADARAIRCRACGRAITTSAERTAIAGAHEHTRFNPHGFVFRFGCFRSAPGCAVVGQPIAEDTWFTGLRWRIALCAGCGEHLGWHFDGDSLFFGLVLERLVEDGGD